MRGEGRCPPIGGRRGAHGCPRRGAASELRFHLGWRRDLSLELVGRPFHWPGAAPQEVSLELNGTSLGPPLVLDGGHERVLRLEIGAGLQVV